MKNSLALIFILFAVDVRGQSTNDTSGRKLIVEDGNGKLIEVDPNTVDFEDPEAFRGTVVGAVTFHLHTVKNPGLSEGQQIWPNDDETLSQSYFDPSIPTRIVTHGWLNNASSDACVLVREAYLKHGKYNVIVVDWGKIAHQFYTYARSRVRIVGEYVGQMIDFLASRGMNAHDTIAVGHSLGAHVVGIAARNATSTVGYVVALDPAQPLFAFAGLDNRVAKGDAEYVQAIHTNAGLLGYVDPTGDVDFYPNGGVLQPGCILVGCSHGRSYMYFAESINSKTGFVATKCDSLVEYLLGGCNGNHKTMMGGANPTVNATGSYSVETNDAPPYAKGG